MKLPRFHLATILLATLVFSTFVGLNLLGRPRMTVHFGISFLPQNTVALTGITFSPKFPKGNVLVNPDRTSRLSVGWPTEVAAFPKFSTMSAETYLIDPTAAELQELQRLSQAANASEEWDSREFQALAPNLTQAYFGDTPHELPGYDFRHPQFLKLSELKHCTWNALHVALNAAVAIAIAFALAGSCEIFLRRKRGGDHSTYS